MKQTIVTKTNRFEFDSEVEQLLANGWRIIPGTLSVSVSVSRNGTLYQLLAVGMEK